MCDSNEYDYDSEKISGHLDEDLPLTCSRKKVSSLKDRKWSSKTRSRKTAKHPLWPKENHSRSEELPSLESLQRHVHQNLVSRYDTVVEWVENSITAPELLSNITETEEYNAFHVLDLGVVVKQAWKWKKNLPRVQPYYAVKANPDINIVKTLFLLGVNFDCASKGEIEEVLSIGADPSQIIYANPAKGLDHIRYAKDKDVRLMTFDNLSELTKIIKIYPEAELVLRIASNDSLSLLPFGFKFGATFKEAIKLISACKELGANLVGISFHVGSCCYSPLAFVDTLKRAKELFMEAEKVGFHLNLLDIGGGFPGDEESKITFEDLASAIADVIDDLFDDDVHVIAEPGRYFCSACTSTALQVYSKRDYTSRRRGENGELVEIEEVQYYLPDGVYGSFNSIMYDHATPICRPLKEPPLDATLVNSTFFGPTCDSIDVIAKQIHFPQLEVGDWVYFLNMGAYTIAAGSTFNGFDRPAILYKMIKGEGFSGVYL